MERHPGSLVLYQEVDLLIDFRFFIIAIVAVFLALGLGVVLGSGFLGDVPAAIRAQVEEVLRDNRELEREILELEARLDEDQEFMTAVEPVVLEAKLASEQVVLIQIEGTGGSLAEGVRGAVEEADGEVVTQLTLSNKLALADAEARADLARALGSGLTQPGELRDLLGTELGARLEELTDPGGGRGRRRGPDNVGGAELLQRLVSEGFLSIEGEGPTVPEDAGFVLLTGSPDVPEWPVEPFVESLATSLAQRRAPVVVAETSDSAWGVVGGLRQGDAADGAFSTVDNGETPAGRVAVALALDDAPESTGHWGLEDGAAAPVPTPSE